MDIRKVTEQFAVAPQISADDLAAIKAAGIKAIVVNRPDGEVSEDLAADEIMHQAEALGLQCAYVPYLPEQNPLEVLPDFSRALADLPEPTLAYCRSGTRSITLWALSQKGQLSADAILQAAQAAGYDLSAYKQFLEHQG